MRGFGVAATLTLTPSYKPPAGISCSSPLQTSSTTIPIALLTTTTRNNRRPLPLSRRHFHTACCENIVSSSSSKCNSYNNVVDDNNNNFIVVNFYHFVFLKYPEDDVSKHLAFLQGLDIHGRIYLNEQGINAQLEGGISHLPLLDPSMRATPLTPVQWRDKLEAKKKVEISNADLNSGYILLDVRNGYEWDIGHFQGAQRPDVDCFRSTSFGLSQPEVIASDPLARVDKEKTDILMYCTGGIRCDVYSAILRQRGFNNLYTLKGGVSHYLKNEGPVEWVGNLFVFDSRLSLPPSAFKPDDLTEANRTQVVSKNSNSSFAVCYICGSQLSELRHRNCANIDCNLLFLCCMSCMKDLRGCCCSKCTSATRIRPVLPGHQRYQKGHYYRDQEELQSR